MDYERIRAYHKMTGVITKDYGLDAELILAIIYKESLGITWAERYEPNYKDILDVRLYAKKNMISEETERIGQMTSRGLCQIMGGTARYLGFDGRLGELFVPHINIRLAAKFMCRLLTRHSCLDDAVASYNAGKPRLGPDGKYLNQKYVDDVLYNYRTLRTMKPDRPVGA